MTTIYTGPTPYDDEQKNFEEWWAANPLANEESLRKRQAYALQLSASIEGYRRAMQDCAPLLEAAKAAYVNLARWQDAEQWDDEDEVVMIRLAEAIAQHEGRDQPASQPA